MNVRNGPRMLAVALAIAVAALPLTADAVIRKPRHAVLLTTYETLGTYDVHKSFSVVEVIDPTGKDYMYATCRILVPQSGAQGGCWLENSRTGEKRDFPTRGLYGKFGYFIANWVEVNIDDPYRMCIQAQLPPEKLYGDIDCMTLT